MKSILILASAIFTAACTSPETQRRTELMNEIENEVKLPPGSGIIDGFARAYKFASSDRVVAFYFVPDGGHDRWFCEGAKKGGRTNGQIALACPPPEGMKAGERRWFGDDVYLPDVCDGGCNYIDVEYDVGSRKVISARCHGVG